MAAVVSVGEIGKMLRAETVRASGHETERDYLGMSQISRCPRALYEELLTGRKPVDEDRHLLFYTGYLFERSIKERLQACGLMHPVSERLVYAVFDRRFRGHTDGELADGRLLEIKSTICRKLEEIKESRRLPMPHYMQVQCYLRHGIYESAVMVYAARDTGAIWTMEIEQDFRTGERCDRKARAVLACVDQRLPPSCECRRCG